MSIHKKSEAGVPPAEICRENSISSALFYVLCSRSGEMDFLNDPDKRTGARKCKLKKMYVKEKLEVEIVQKVLEKKRQSYLEEKR